MDTNNLALRLKRLFEEKRKSDGTQYSQREIIEGLRGGITPVYLWKLSNGHACNPSMQVIRSLADFFGVDPGYFFESDALQVVPDKDRLQNERARKILTRSSQLEPGEQDMVLLVIESILRSKRPKRSRKPKKLRKQSSIESLS